VRSWKGGDHVAWTTDGSPTTRVQSLPGGGASSPAGGSRSGAARRAAAPQR